MKYKSTSDDCTYEVKSEKIKGKDTVLIRCLDSTVKSNKWEATTQKHIDSMVAFGRFKEIK